MIKKTLKDRVKKITAVTFMCMLFSTTAFAARQEFTFEIPKGGVGFTAANPKSDDEIYAYVTITSAKLNSKDKIKYVVSDKNMTKEVTTSHTFGGNDAPNKQKFKYKSSSYAKQGKKYRLKIQTYNYSRRISGVWNS